MEKSRREVEQISSGIRQHPLAAIEVQSSHTVSRDSNPTNPFSPPASVISFSSRGSTADYSPVHTPGIFTASSAAPADLAPDVHVRASATPSWPASELSRAWSNFATNRHTGTSDRPATVGNLSSSGVRPREAFHAPPSRPMTAFSTALPNTKIRGERMRSTMLASDTSITKLWLEDKRDSFSRIAYFLTYTVMLLGVLGGALRCFFAWKDVRLMSDNLCLVMEDNFDGSELSGNWMKEVQMDGFGSVPSS
jgi:hypothetical protein